MMPDERMEAEKSGFLSIEDLQRLASPQPANPAQVTDALVNVALNAFDDGVGDPNDYNRRMRKALEAAFALTAAIGAGKHASKEPRP
jgi:hypothetical protein